MVHQCKTATGELTTDHGCARISGHTHGGQLYRISGRLVDVHKTLMSLSKCTRMGHNGWHTKGGGYLVPEDSTLSHKIKNFNDKEGGKPRSGVVE